MNKLSVSRLRRCAGQSLVIIYCSYHMHANLYIDAYLVHDATKVEALGLAVDSRIDGLYSKY
jgi:hypothetical protein